MRFFPRRSAIVFLGDSITWEWARHVPGLFDGHRLNRGIPIEKTADMAARFERDVLRALPRALHLMGGTNDLWDERSASAAADVVANLGDMIRAARRARIRTYLASVPPIDARSAIGGSLWGPMIAPLNLELRALARSLDATFVDYAAVLGAHGQLLPRFSADGVHLTEAAYRAMGGVLRKAGFAVPSAPR